MPVPWPTVQNIEDYLQYVEEVVVSSVSSATADMPSIRQTFQRLWEDIDRFGPWQSLPALPDIKMPILGAFEVPPPPPPPPAPRGLWDRSADWASDHSWKAVFIGIGVVGTGVAVGYAGMRFRGAFVPSRRVRGTNSGHANTERRQVVGAHTSLGPSPYTQPLLVVLGGDSPLGLPLILDLEQLGYIVITSVSTPEAGTAVEGRSHGYVRAIVLDPSEVRIVVALRPTGFAHILYAGSPRRFSTSCGLSRPRCLADSP